MCSARHEGELTDSQVDADSDLGLSLDTDTCIVHKQTNKDCATTKTDLTEEKQQRRRDASATRRNKLVNVGK